jgi:hypothetical protein
MQQPQQRLAVWLLALLLAAASSCAQFLPFDCQGAGAATPVTATTGNSTSSNSSSSSRVDPFFRQPYVLVAPAAYYINRTRPVLARQGLETAAAAAAELGGSSSSRGDRTSAAAAAAAAGASEVAAGVQPAAVCPMDSAFQARGFSM